MERKRPHALVLPLPAQGHVNPMLNFATCLAKRGVVVTFVNTEKALQRFNQNKQNLHSHGYGELLRFAVIPGGYQENPPPGVATMDPAKMDALLNGIASQQRLLEQMVIDSRKTSDPITCIISDSFFSWTQQLVSKLGIQRFVFWTTCGMSLTSVMEMTAKKYSIADIHNMDNNASNDPENKYIVTGGHKFLRSDFSSALPLLNNPEIGKRFVERLNGIESITSIIVNTFEELEHASLKASLWESKVRYVGPIMPPVLENNATLSANFYEEESECLKWLDKQKKGSVLYISFGSAASLAPQQLGELAAGIEESKQPFLWVARDSMHLFSREFIDRTQNYGIVIKWAPQVQVLAHPAVGSFMTHCGWNSVIESINMGVPMLCFPCFGDQFINALLITKCWNLGVSVIQRNNEINRAEVCKAITEVMNSKDIQHRAAELKAAACKANEPDGSSSKAMEDLVNEMTAAVF